MDILRTNSRLIVLTILGIALRMSAVSAQQATWTPSGSVGSPGGSGTWDTTTALWNSSGSLSTWNNASSGTAVFGTTAGTVSLGAPITANGLMFTTGGYTLTGGTLTLSGSGTIAVNTGVTDTARIDSVIAGSAGLTKTGSGVLVLGAANTYAGQTNIAAGTLRLTGNDQIDPNSTSAETGNPANLPQIGSGATLDLNGYSQTLNWGYRSTDTNTPFGNWIGPGATLTGGGTLTILHTATAANGRQFGSLSGTVTIGANTAFVANRYTSTNVLQALVMESGTAVIAGDSSGSMTFGSAPGSSGGTGSAIGANGGEASLTINGPTLNIVNSSGRGKLIIGSGSNGRGTLVLNSGTVNVSEFVSLSGNFDGRNGAAGAGVLTINGGAFRVGTGTVALSNGGMLALGTGPLAGGSSGTGAVNLNGGILSVTRIISATNGNQTLTLNSGTLQMRANNVIASLNTSGGINTTLAVNVADGGGTIDTFGFTTTVATNMVGTGTGGITKIGGGSLVYTGSNTYTGATTVQSGTLAIGNGGTTGSIASASAVSVDLGAGLLFNRSDDYGGAFANAISGSGGVSVAAGSLIFANAKTYTGQTTISGGTLSIGNGGVSGSVHSLSDFVVGAGAMLRFNRSDDYGGAFTNAISGNGGVVVAGGNLTFAGDKTYTGPTLVDAGTLRVNGSLGASALSVAAGAMLAGTGTIGGPAVISGIHAPGNEASGIQTFSDGVTYTAVSAINWELARNTAAGADRGLYYDGVNVSGKALSIANGSTINLLFNTAGSTVSWSDPFWGSNRSWQVIDVLGTATWNGVNFTNVAWGVDANGFALSGVRNGAYFNVTNTNGDVYVNYFAVAAVPEPTGIALAAIGLAAACVYRRRRLANRDA